MDRYAINKSGKTIEVRESNAYGAKKIGTLYHNECFAVTDARDIQGSPGSQYLWIYFKSTSGMKHGVISVGTANQAYSFLNYSFGNVTVNGSTFKSFKTRKALGYYDASGKLKGTCVKGARVLTNDTTPGSSNPELMCARYVETGVGTNQWIPISGDKNKDGFISTGLSGGSDASKIGVYGNW
jgi:hypothetical protein